MEQRNIGYGIYLGAEHASIAYADGTSITVFKNNEGQESTPSAVYIDKNNNLIVGRVAEERAELDPDRVFMGFIRDMGTDIELAQQHEKSEPEDEFQQIVRMFSTLFEDLPKRNAPRMKPEELSAEVLKSLLANVEKHTGHRPQAAVITVPAVFGLQQCEATKRAAELAGVRVSPLLAEPVAAALAYGFQNERDGVYWLVYDFGGGTFDATLVEMRDGMIGVVTHEGDYCLGGKDIDWAIVDELLIPAVTQKFQVTDFGRRTKKAAKWRGAIAKLKGAAEDAKIQLSTAETVEIDIDFLCQDDQGDPIKFDYTLTRRDFERVAEPIIFRSIQICRNLLAQKVLASHTIDKVILVGEATRMPYLRQRLEQELKIPLEFHLDPMTIVARGAAIFASLQRLEADPVAPPVQGEYSLRLEGKPAGPETEPYLGGTVLGQEGEDLRSFTIEFINSTTVPPWKSGTISLGPNGQFLTTLWAEAGRINRFDIHLSDATGRLCKTTPSHWQYEVIPHGIAAQSMITTVGVGLANNGFCRYIEKGAPLPARCTKSFSTHTLFLKGQSEPFFSLPLYEGEEPQADLNRQIGELRVRAEDIHQDLPANTEVELTIAVDESRLVSSTVFIPILDTEFRATIQLSPSQNLDEVHSRVKAETLRLERLRRAAEETTCGVTHGRLEIVQHGLQEVALTLQCATFDHSTISECDNRLRRLRSSLNEVESIIQSEENKRNLLAEHAFLIEGLNTLYGKHGGKEQSNEADDH